MWWCDDVDLLWCVFVLCVDYELNLLIFVVCCIVLIGSYLFGVILGGFVVLLGLCYGGEMFCVGMLFDEVVCVVDFDCYFVLWLVYDECVDGGCMVLFGFVYLLYFDGDLCVWVLFDVLYVMVFEWLVLCMVCVFVVCVEVVMGLWLMIDFVFVVLECMFVLFDGVVFMLFVVGCMVGWIVYVFE